MVERYFTGKPCSKGHIAERRVSDRKCVECEKQRSIAKVAKWRKSNPERYRRSNKAVQAKRKAAKLNRTPGWADLAEIKRFYEDCPEGMHVDHVVPLQGLLVSGLHVIENLQYLVDVENLSKGNSFVVD